MRMSRKQVESYCKTLKGYTNYRLIINQQLGNRADYYYTYSLVIDNDNDEYESTVIKDSTLKAVGAYLSDEVARITA